MSETIEVVIPCPEQTPTDETREQAMEAVAQMGDNIHDVQVEIKRDHEIAGHTFAHVHMYTAQADRKVDA